MTYDGQEINQQAIIFSNFDSSLPINPPISKSDFDILIPDTQNLSPSAAITEELINFKESLSAALNNTAVTGSISTLSAATAVSSIATQVGAQGASAASTGASFTILRWFQILEILGNINKINVDVGKGKVSALLELLEEIGNLNLSFLDWSKIKPLAPNVSEEKIRVENEEDSRILEYKTVEHSFILSAKQPRNLIENPYIHEEDIEYETYRRGSRGKVGQERAEVFLIEGETGTVAFITIILWLVTIIVGPRCSPKNKCMSIVNYIYLLLFNIFYFDFEFVAVSELAFHEINTTQPFYLNLSYVMSVFMINILVFESLNSFVLFNKLKKLDGSKAALKKYKESLGYLDEQLFDKYCEGMNLLAIRRGSIFMWMMNFRFIMMIVLIVCFQIMNSTQIALLVLGNGIYFVYFMIKVFKFEIFDSKILKIKFLTQEVSIMVLLTLYLFFDLTESTDIKGNLLGDFLEYLAIVSVLLTALSELLHAMYCIGLQVHQSIKKCREKKKNSVEDAKLGTSKVKNMMKQGLKPTSGRKDGEKDVLFVKKRLVIKKDTHSGKKKKSSIGVKESGDGTLKYLK